MIQPHPDDPPLTVREAAEIGRITAVAVMRSGVMTTRQEKRVDKILDTARKRAEKAAAKK